MKEPSSKSQDTGNEVHEQLQHYTSTGEDVLGPIAREGKRFVHLPGPGLLVEHEELGAVSLAGVPFYVRMDLQNSGEFWLDDDGERQPLRVVEVVDHKTSSDIGSWGKSGRDLLKTTQMVVYGAYALRDGTAPAVRLSHCYYGTRRRESLKSSAEVTRGEVEDRLGAISGIVERMKVAATATTGAELEGDFSKCKRCAHVPYCPRPPSVQFQNVFALMGLTSEQVRPTLPDGGDTTMASVLEKLKMQKSAPAAETPTPAPAPVVTPAAAPAIDQAAVSARVAELEAQLAAAKAGAAPAPNVTLTGADAKKVVPDLPANSAVLTSAAIAAAAGVLPPDAPKSGATAPAADPIPEAMLATMSPEIQQAHAEVFAPTIAQAHEAAALGAPDAAAVMAAAEAATPPATKKTRAKKEPETIVQNATITAPAERGPFTGIGTSPSAPLVLIDAVVSGAEATSLESYVTALLARICDKQKTFDVRVAPNKDSILGYGGWRGVVRASVTSDPPPPGVYTLRVGSCEVREEIAWGLQAVPGAVVIRGVR